jgi:hypothetical protein
MTAARPSSNEAIVADTTAGGAGATYRGAFCAGAIVYLRTLVTQHPPSAFVLDTLGALPDQFRQSNARLPELLRMAGELRDHPEVLRSALQSLRGDVDALRAVAVRSSTHPNKFTKIVLYEGRGYGVRLHVWHPEPPEYGLDTDPHGHRWEFASWIVVGALREEIFTEAADGTWHGRFAYSRQDGRPHLRRMGEVTLRRVKVIERGAGDVYCRARSVVHTASPAVHDLVATLVLQGPTAFEPTHVYQPEPRPEHEETPLTPERVRAVLGDVVAVL